MTTATAVVLGVILAADAAALFFLCKEIHKLVRHKLGVLRIHHSLRRLDKDLDRPTEPDRTQGPTDPTAEPEAEEVALCRRLSQGVLDSATYQQAMSALAHSVARRGAVR